MYVASVHMVNFLHCFARPSKLHSIEGAGGGDRADIDIFLLAVYTPEQLCVLTRNKI